MKKLYKIVYKDWIEGFKEKEIKGNILKDNDNGYMLFKDIVTGKIYRCLLSHIIHTEEIESIEKEQTSRKNSKV